MLYQKISLHIVKVLAVLALTCLSLGAVKAAPALEVDPMGGGIDILIFDNDQVSLEQVNDKDDVIKSCPAALSEVRLRQGDAARLYVAASIAEAGCQLAVTNGGSVDLQYRVDGTRWRPLQSGGTIIVILDTDFTLEFVPDTAPWPTDGLIIGYEVRQHS